MIKYKWTHVPQRFNEKEEDIMSEVKKAVEKKRLYRDQGGIFKIYQGMGNQQCGWNG